ncbi:hypothetical protein OH687_27310 [Burkholderia anthina]|nr:hypothetical protein OH687_27310 [Burkholderia anthina]
MPRTGRVGGGGVGYAARTAAYARHGGQVLGQLLAAPA